MRNVMIEDLEEIIGNKYLAANIAARRARQLSIGVRPRIKTNHIKHPTIALEELAAGELEYKLLPRETKPDKALYPSREVDEEISEEFRKQMRFVTEKEEKRMDKEALEFEDT
ncbi:TPA: DNA-directed RNA polymerase subunit omega [Candidatus Poribacteria bacterium]|nr:DNA-directed RNA polymerase subunit omega [Candidatus Poribacteria bacterium]